MREYVRERRSLLGIMIVAPLDEGRQHRRAIGRAIVGGPGGVGECVHSIEQLQLTRDELVFQHLPSLPSSVSPSLPMAQLRMSLSPTATHHMTCSHYNNNITWLYFCAYRYHTYGTSTAAYRLSYSHPVICCISVFIKFL